MNHIKFQQLLETLRRMKQLFFSFVRELKQKLPETVKKYIPLIPTTTTTVAKKIYARLSESVKRRTSKFIEDIKEKPQIPTEDFDFISDSKTAVITRTTPFANVVLYILIFFIIIGLIWAHFAILDEVTTADGKVVPSSQTQVIQNLEGGILESILVSEGQTVQKGQILVKLNDTQFTTQYREEFAKYNGLLATISRLQAEINHENTINFPPSVQKDPELMRHETNLFNSRNQAFKNSVKNLEASYELADHELKITEPLVKKGVISQIELLRLKREVNNAKGRLDERTDKFRETALGELADKKTQLAALSETLLGLQDRMTRTVVRSPVTGVVNQIFINTIGGIIKPGMDIMEVVPLEDNLLIEAKVRPHDIAFIHPKEAATVKISAYDFSIYGGLPGTVEHISPTTTMDQEGENYYEVLVRTERNYLGSSQHPLPIIPGMTATVDILTGQKSVLNYILKPIIKAKNKALRER